MLLIDAIVFIGLKQFFRRYKRTSWYKYIFILNISVLVLFIVYFFAHFLYIGYPGLDYLKYRSFFWLLSIFLLVYLPKFNFSIFVLLQNILYFIINRRSVPSHIEASQKKHRNKTLFKLGFYSSVVIFLLVLNGILFTKSDFLVQREDVYIDDLPKEFDNFKILQFSDAHLGSFYNKEDVMRGVLEMMKQNPDLIVFTGDLVNNTYDETLPYISWFKNLKAPYGQYSILGNHDVGDYVQWQKTDTKKEYIDKLKVSEMAMGFQLLLNKNVIIHKGNDSIALIGVENWGMPPFKQYGDLKKAMNGVEKMNVKILLSHDPSHWRQQVLLKTNIDLTLSGHTHGAQLGIRFRNFKWSPVSFKYKEWLGMYEDNNQKLYINAGFGYIGFIGRIGIQPEITVLTLHPKTK